MDKPKLKLVGEDGNAFAILGRASRVAKENNMDWEVIRKEAMAGDYNHLLSTMMKYFDTDGDEDEDEETIYCDECGDKLDPFEDHSDYICNDCVEEDD